jgi:hypothetical protein
VRHAECVPTCPSIVHGIGSLRDNTGSDVLINKDEVKHHRVAFLTKLPGSTLRIHNIEIGNLM